MCNEINYAESARRVFEVIKKIDVENGESLQPFMEYFENIRIKEVFVLDAFNCGNSIGASFRFYARRKDASEPFIEPEDMKADFFSRVAKRISEHLGCDIDDTDDDYENDLY